MATPQAAAGPANQAQPGLGQQLFGVLRMTVIGYIIMQFLSPKRPPSNPAPLMANLYSKADPLDMWFYISKSSTFTDFKNKDTLLWQESKVPYAEWGPDSVRRHRIAYNPAEILRHNSSLYAHVFFTHSGYSPNPNDPKFDKLTFSKSHPIVVFFPKPKQDKRKNLLGGIEEEQQKEAAEAITETADEITSEWVPFWKPNVTINLVADFTRYSQNATPPTIADYLIIDSSTSNYFPIIYLNEFWLLRDKLIQVNETVEELYMELELGPISTTKWQLFMQIDQSFRIHQNYGSMGEGESDRLKRVFLEGNPYLLLITMAVSLLHSVFDMLAFKSDIQFWKQNKSMQGLSAKSVVVGFICQLVIFLYLLDNETSWMILFSSGLGCCIEFWKIGKAMHIEIDRSRGFPLLRFRDRESYGNNKTKEYDDLAMKYLGYALFFLVACFAIYSLMYERHRSWYSWILSSLTSCVYTFGFIMMCPQLFINYKLKSVAHLPWRQMTYKFLNTIIDDLFAFVIKMPALHRLSVFRDDAIFLIYLYQRWIYPVDKSRVNEFGFGGVEKDENEEGTATSDGLLLPTPEEKKNGDEGLVRTATGTALDKSKPVASKDNSREDKKTK